MENYFKLKNKNKTFYYIIFNNFKLYKNKNHIFK